MVTITANGQGLLSVIEFENIKMEQMQNRNLLIGFLNYCQEKRKPLVLDADNTHLVDDYLSEQLLQQTQCTTQLEFEKQMTSSTTLSDRLKEYLKTVKAEDLIEKFEKLGYEFVPIDNTPIAPNG